MDTHQFIFCAGEWLGMGKIQLPIFPKPIVFYTKWIVQERDQSSIRCEQQLEIEGAPELLINSMQFILTDPKAFAVTVQNAMFGTMTGSGTVRPEQISWHFERKVAEDGTEALEGTEVYTLQADGEYQLYAEYRSDGKIHTEVVGRLWRK